MAESTKPNPLKRMRSPEFQREVENIQKKVPKTTDPPGDLDAEKKRWLIVGICLHSIISPLLRKYVDPIVSNLYNVLVSRKSFDTQSFNGHLEKEPPSNKYFLNYESINNNMGVPKIKKYNTLVKDYQKYDYKVRSHVDFSKLFLQPNMALYSAFDDSCDSSALLGMIINISSFPTAIRSDIRNSWAHCSFGEWNAKKYSDSFSLMKQLVKDLGLSSIDENSKLGELDTWKLHGQNFLSGTRLGLEVVDQIREQTHVLSKYVLTLCAETESELMELQTYLNQQETDLQDHRHRLLILESKLKEREKQLTKIKEEKKNYVEDHIPKHIRDQHRQEIREWDQDQTTFFKTRATHHLLRSLSLHNCIIVTGSSGCGKSSNIHHAAIHLRDIFGYEIIYVLSGPTDIINYYNENKKQVFVVDDICGKETINTQTLQIWRDYSEKLEKMFKLSEKNDARRTYGMVSKVTSPKLLISCRLHIYKESQFQRIDFFTLKECNLLSPELCLLQKERMLMLHKYLPADIIANVKQVIENVDFFPLLCKLAKDQTLDEVRKLFIAPLKSIKRNIDNIIHDNEYQFCALVLCILFGGEFNTDSLALRSASDWKSNKLRDIVEEFDINLSKEKHRNSLQSGFSTLNGTYLKRRGTKYRIIHDKIYKMVAVLCGQKRTECFIKYAPPVFIRDTFIFKSLMDVHENNDSIVLLLEQEEDYFERLLLDLNDHFITSTFHNNQLIYQAFIDKLISFLSRSDGAKKVLKELDTQGCVIDIHPDKRRYMFKEHYLTTPLIESTVRGYFDIVYFLINNIKCNANKTDEKGRFPLYQACERGHSAIAKLLLEKNADVLQTNEWTQQSPLYVACKGGHIYTVKLLLQNNADVFQCNSNGESPLFAACGGGHTDTVTFLLQNNADVDQCNTNEESPLFAACEGGHTDTVELLLQKKADVFQGNSNNESPLFAACGGGHTDTVTFLLQNNADIDQCNANDESPLFAACEGGHTDTVELLLQKKADVFKCNSNNESPLFTACEGGHTDTVELLLQNNADVDQYNTENQYPLHSACYGGHKDIVELLLLQNMADASEYDAHAKCHSHGACAEEHIDTEELLIQNHAGVDTCNKFGQSPLFLACKGGHTGTVELLLQYNASVSQCNNMGESGLHMACLGGYADTVELLLKMKANVSHCNDNGKSPLYMACTGAFPASVQFEGGHRNVVKLLLQNNADVSQCHINGESPLYVACKGGHSDIVDILLQNNADVSQCSFYAACKEGHTDTVELLLQNKAYVAKYIYNDDDGECPLYAHCKGGHTDTVELLIQNKAYVSKCNDDDGESPLYVACKGGHTDTVALLLRYNADVNDGDVYGEFPLNAACLYGHSDTVTLLLQNNADVLQCNTIGDYPLCTACKVDCVDTVSLLLKHNTDVAQCNELGQSPLWLACRRGHKGTVEMLLQNNAKVSQCDDDGVSPLFVACERGFENIVQLLLQNNADVSQCNNYKQSPLYGACKGGQTNIVKLLLQRVQNKDDEVYQCDISGQSLLFIACEGGHKNTVELLLQNNADVSQCNTYKQSPLYVACKGGHTYIVKLLLTIKDDVSQCDNSGQSLLYIACAGGHEDIVKLLLLKSADVLQCNNVDESPLYVACKGDHLETVKLLLQGKADIFKCETNGGQSPLHVVCDFPRISDLESIYYVRRRSQDQIVQLLLALNADVGLTNKKGQTPLDIATKSQSTDIVHLLERHLNLKASLD